MAIVVLEHHPVETAARLGQILRDQGHHLRVIALHDGDDVPVDLDNVDGILSMGGPMNYDQTDQYPWIEKEMAYMKQAHDKDLPIVGICLGAQMLAVALGGEAGKLEGKPEIGMGMLKQSFFGSTDPIHAGIPWNSIQFHCHGCEVTTPPPGGTPAPLSSTDRCKCQAFRAGSRSYGLQYHPEWDREDLDAVMNQMANWIRDSGLDIDEIRRGIDEHYDMYRHLSDRMCENIATLLMPVSKRLVGTGRNW